MHRSLPALAAGSAAALLAAAAHAAGPDLLGGNLMGATRFTTISGVSAYGLAIDSCNVGVARLQVQASSNRHPITTQNIYRLSNGRFEQIGMGWVFHHFCALQAATCGTCQPAPACDELGVGCSSSDTAGILGSQPNLGPRSQVNAPSASFPFPFTAPGVADGLSRRVQVADADLSPALNPGAVYFAESINLAPDDAASGNALNGASHRRYTVSGVGPFTLTQAGVTSQGAPAILAWAAADPGVSVSIIDVPGDGRFYIASKATPVACNRYAYEYAVFNLNSDRSAKSFSVPFAAPGTATAIGFHDIAYHSGEPYSTADWPAAAGACELAWSTDDFAADANANAIRWGTLYNFRFESRWLPANADAMIGLFKPGVPASMDAGVVAPGTQPVFPGDYDGDAAVGLGDIAFVLLEWFNPCGTPFGVADISSIILNWGETCP